MIFILNNKNDINNAIMSISVYFKGYFDDDYNATKKRLKDVPPNQRFHTLMLVLTFEEFLHFGLKNGKHSITSGNIVWESLKFYNTPFTPIEDPSVFINVSQDVIFKPFEIFTTIDNKYLMHENFHINLYDFSNIHLFQNLQDNLTPTNIETFQGLVKCSERVEMPFYIVNSDQSATTQTTSDITSVNECLDALDKMSSFVNSQETPNQTILDFLNTLTEQFKKEQTTTQTDEPGATSAPAENFVQQGQISLAQMNSMLNEI